MGLRGPVNLLVRLPPVASMDKRARDRNGAHWFGASPSENDEGDRWPQKKYRGNQRYYRALDESAASFNADLTGWSNLAHWHVDWNGRGNVSWQARKAHLAALFTMFQRLLDQLAVHEEPSQCWLLIDATNSANDALYLHTPNPHTPFPMELTGIDWNAEVPATLQAFVLNEWTVGRSDIDGTKFIVRAQ